MKSYMKSYENTKNWRRLVLKSLLSNEKRMPLPYSHPSLRRPMGRTKTPGPNVMKVKATAPHQAPEPAKEKKKRPAAEAAPVSATAKADQNAIKRSKPVQQAPKKVTKSKAIVISDDDDDDAELPNQPVAPRRMAPKNSKYPLKSFVMGGVSGFDKPRKAYNSQVRVPQVYRARRRLLYFGGYIINYSNYCTYSTVTRVHSSEILGY